MKTETSTAPALKELATLFCVLFLLCTAAVEAGEEKQNEDLTSLDLATLMQMDVEVTTASKTAQSIYDVAAPIYVISSQDIRRSGATSIPEALRMAPGVVVGQIDPAKWVVAPRGFATQYANKALVLLDGRAVYTPYNSSVYWNTLDIPMEDIERIEVIRGPGDARWGSHAVNGIVNIITKLATDTRGGLASVTVDSEGGRILSVRHGGALSTNLNYRAYAKYLSQDDFTVASGDAGLHDRSALRAGLRLDGEISGGDRIVFIGDIQSGRDTAIIPAQAPVPHYDADEWSALVRWERNEPGRVNQQAQLSFDRLNQEIYEERETLDFAYQVQLPEFRRNIWTIGATYKRSSDVTSPALRIVPARMTQNVYGAFLHDRIVLSETSQLSFGSQFERNRFTGWELQPNLQFLYKPHEQRSFWASVSRAVRTPLRTEDGFNFEFPIFPGAFGRFVGNEELKAERVLAWQAGARLTIRDDWFVDIAAFYNEYDDLVMTSAGVPFFEPLPPPGRTIFPQTYTNSLSGHTRGVETVLKGRPLPGWDLAVSYSLYSQTPWSDPLGFGSVAAVEHQFQVHSSAAIVRNLEWNVSLYYTDGLTTGDVPEYYKLDTQLAWKPVEALRLSVGIRNALSPRHREIGINSIDVPTRIPRTVYLNTSWQI